MAAYLHDIGKIGISEDILLKPGALEPDEMSQMRHHPLIGANILRPVAFPWAIAPVARHHHERWDGTGYPAGLRGDEIPMLARVLTVADAFEAMTADRPYRPPRTEAEALKELQRCAGSQFDPRCVDALIAALAETELERRAIGAQQPGDVEPDEARAIFVAVCDGMLTSFRRLGGPRLAANLEGDLNRWFASEGLPYRFDAGRLSATWEPGVGREDELRTMRTVVGMMASAMGTTTGPSLVESFYGDALAGLTTRMRLLADTLELYSRAA
jgi:hypothetical protein